VKEFIKSNAALIEWLLGAFVIVSSILVWVMTREVGDKSLTIYDIFPVFGLLAFGLMWTHFVMGALRTYAYAEHPENSLYGTLSMGLVLGLIILHPLLLWLGLYNDGYGLPPGSYLTAYASQATFVSLGSLGLAIFLAFEFKRVFGEKSWWKYVEWAQIVGMTAIFFHAINLGGELDENWFMLVWWFYGITLAGSVIYSFIANKKQA
jgi:hypothetical protein